MRKGEILGLEWKEVDLENRRISLPASRTKSGKPRYVDINSDADRVLREQLKLNSDGGINYVFHRKGKRLGEVKTAWCHFRRRAKLPDKARFHDLRHTVISKLSEAGVPEGHIQDMFWAKSSGGTMIRRYAHPCPENRQKSMKILERSNRSHDSVTRQDNGTFPVATRQSVSA